MTSEAENCAGPTARAAVSAGLSADPYGVAAPDRPLRRLRIAMVAACPFPLRRGTPVRILRMAEALAFRGHEVHVVTYHLGDELPDSTLRIHRIPPVRSYTKLTPGPTYQKLLVLDPLLRRTLRALLAGQDFDVIHAHHYEGLLVAWSLPRRARPPIVYDAHTLLASELPYYSMGLTTRIKQALGAYADRTLPGRAAHVIGVTEALRTRLVEIDAVPADRISVIGSGVELDLFDVPAARRPDGRTVVFAGNLAPYQGIELLLYAFQQVRLRRDDVRLCIVTDSDFGPYEALARQLGIRSHIELPSVTFEQLPAELRAADVAVNPRINCEGIPLKLMNYMAAGCPIVSFASSAVHLRHDSTGWIVPDADVAGLAHGILRLLADPARAQRLGAAAREQMAQEFSWERVADQVEAVYTRVVESPFRSRQSVPTVAPAPVNDTAPANRTAGRSSAEDPVRVLFLYDHLGYANGVVHGLTRYCLDVLPLLNAGSVALTACFLRDPHPAGEVLRRRGVAPIFLGRSRWDPRALPDVLRLIREHRIGVVHAVGQKGILVGCAAARLTGCASIIHLRDVYPLGTPLRALMRLAVHDVDVVLGVSQAVCGHAVREYGVPAARTRLLYNGIDLDVFGPADPGAVAEWRSRAGLPVAARVIGVIGRLSAVKGHAGLIAHMPDILRRMPQAVLVVVGDGPLRRQLERAASGLSLGDAVRFVGQHDDMRTVLGAMDVVAIPSDHEGLSHVALESHAVGRPVVAFDAGGLRETLNHGVCGVLVPAGDFPAFARAVVDVLEDSALAERLVQGGRRHVQQFTLSDHVEQQLEIYHRVAETGARSARPIVNDRQRVSVSPLRG